MITRNLVTALAAGLLAVASQTSFAQTSHDPSSTPSQTVHAYQGGPKTVVPHGTVTHWTLRSDYYGSLAGARGEASEFVPEASANPHRYYGGPKYH
jgi:hypothetical protein